jgi:hypothetical protein
MFKQKRIGEIFGVPIDDEKKGTQLKRGKRTSAEDNRPRKQAVCP